MNREWKVLLNGELYTDRFDSEDLAYEYIKECVEDEEGSEDDFEVFEMTEEDLAMYQ